MAVTETFFSIEVADMERATSFYIEALGAEVTFASPRWSSVWIAGVRIGLFLHPEAGGGRTGLHFVVDDLAAAREAVVRAAGSADARPIDAGNGIVIAEAADTEGNTFTLRKQ
jgi:predicted enzyme related to lactoylglutathione lyase